MHKRYKRQLQKIKEMEEAIAKGEANPLVSNSKNGEGNDQEKESKKIESIVVPEDDDP